MNESELAVMETDTEKAIKRSFGLPAGEELIEDFSCAVKRRILLHGRMCDQHTSRPSARRTARRTA